jgi:hypothetical protein
MHWDKKGLTMNQLRFRSLLGGCTRRLLPLSLILALLLAALPAQVARADTPPPVEDASFTMPTDASVTVTSVPFIHVAQTFTAKVTGALHAISIDMTSTSYGGDMYVALMGVTNGVLDGTQLAGVFISEDELHVMSADPLSYQIPMADIFVQAGKQYAIAVHYNSYSTVGPAPQSVWSGATGNLYTGGSAFTSSDGSFANAQPLSDPSVDLHFRTFVITGVPISDISVTRVRGADRATACREFTEIYKVTNNGPDSAEHVEVWVGGTDQFDTVSINGVADRMIGPFTLAAGQSLQVKAIIKVTGFVPGESREGRVGAQVFLESWPDFTIDPLADNDRAENIVWLLGRHVMTCRR